ncbi:prepilin-type N-terminal cleavage/methylation domain-containing protein [Thermodesulfovibrio hydrogeniphilus]
MRNKGYSIIEILIVIAIIGILAGGMFSAYNFMARENVQRHLVAKQEQDVAIVVAQLVKDIETAGFGVDRLNLASLTVGSSGISFISLASREENLSGCWAMVKSDRTLDIKSKNYLGGNCNLNPKDYWYVILDPVGKNNRCPSSTDYLCQCGNHLTYCDEDFKNKMIFYATNRDDYAYPREFFVRYFLSSSNPPKECASGSFNLMKQLARDDSPYRIESPVVSCVLSFKTRAYVGNEYNPTLADTITDLSEFRNMIRLCMVLQVGGRQSTPTEQPQFSNDCGGGPAIDGNWWNNTGRWYRWKVIEQDIVLRNYQAR